MFAFLSGLYFRGKLAYARAFARPPDPDSPLSGAGSFVITPNAGLRSIDTPVTLGALRNFARVDIDSANAKYRRPLEDSARAIADDIGPECAVVLLGSIAVCPGTWTCCRASSRAAPFVFPPTSSAVAT